jgi:hypothetical protein
MIAEPGTRVPTDELDKRLDECQRLQQKALDLTGLRIRLADANKVAIFLPKWWVEAVLPPRVIKFAVWLFDGMWFGELALGRLIALDLHVGV